MILSPSESNSPNSLMLQSTLCWVRNEDGLARRMLDRLESSMHKIHWNFVKSCWLSWRPLWLTGTPWRLQVATDLESGVSPTW